MGTKFIIGPWQAERASMRGVVKEWFVRSDGDDVAIASDIRDGFGNISSANAHLIAAAPELYAALALVVDREEISEDYIKEQAMIALRKAMGEA